MENLEQIRQAIDVELKYGYIDIRGRNKTFSKFIKNEIENEYKASGKDKKWLSLITAFEQYPFETLMIRKKIIKRLIAVIKEELTPKVIEKNQDAKQIKNPSEVDVTYVKGVGQKIAYMLNKLGIYTASDLLFYFPRKHVDYSSRTLIKNLELDTNTTVFGYITSVQNFTTKNNLGILKVKVKDESGIIELNFFTSRTNRYMQERMKAQFPVNAGIIVSGTVKLNSYNGQYTLDKPTYSIIEDEGISNANLNLGRIVPVYSLSENLSMKVLRKAIFNAIETYKPKITNTLPDYLINKYGLLEKSVAIEQIHFPSTMELLEQARYTLIFEELFLAQLKLAQIRENTRLENNSIALKVEKDGLVMKFIKELPFELTGAQKNAVNEILNDLQREEPMQRLLQGDVGSGKTVVACIMLLSAIENGYQAAIMAPTEILAIQHYNNFAQWLIPMGIRVGLFTGSMSKKLRKELETDLVNGQIDIAVGTHVLIQDNVDFANLGAIVIDEQHRFGVKQRSGLKKKAQNPQMLTMTATPIPRTLALTVHGDLDLTILDELPKGRKPIKTIMSNSKRETYKLIRQEIETGRQAYIVYPLIEESETLSAKAATIEAERLRKEVFPDLKIGLLHGKLKNQEKEDVMRDFKDKKYDILVATTVVEVGVDVPNATVIVIENAERFGLSQLHQLRGRVGRCSYQSYCILSSSTKSIETKERLNVMTQTNDGFVIAEKDLELRGPGEFLGTRQSGLPDLIISDIVRDAKILELARNEAIEFVKTKNIKEYPNLKNAETLQNLTGFDFS